MASAQDSAASSEREVLPTNVKPRHYDLTLDLDVNATQFSGKVRIELDIAEVADSITLHSNELDITTASIEDGSGKATDNLSISYEKDKQTATVALPTALPSGSKAVLTLAFTGILKENMCGLFRSAWKDHDNTKKYQISSQFEPVDARTAFPCFDEPALKATFTVTLVADKALTCLSNMPEAHVEEKGNGKKAVTYEKTPLVSTYLIAFAVGELHMIETNSFRIPIRVYTSPNNDIETGRFSLEMAARTLIFFEERLGVPFPLPKMDLLTVPDFMGAMEHWGLITFREDRLLFDSTSGTINQKRLLGDTVVHELAHQWFGNLVTMDWWNGLWLNEGFAVWASIYALDYLFPEWDVRQNFLYTEFREAFDLDSLRNSHPIEAPVRNADEIEQLFDAVSYSKGCSVIRMIAAYMGEDVFIRGIAKYLEKHRYGNTSTNDLWTALSESSGIDVEKIMGKWTLHVGHPVVFVTEQNESIHLKQKRFLRSGDVKPEEDQILYPITLDILCANDRHEDMIFDTRETDVHMGQGFVKLNSKHIGFYRTAYSSERLTTLGKQLSTLSIEDRFGVLSDALALAPPGLQSMTDVLTLLEAYRDESNFIVWKQIISGLRSIQETWMFEDEVILEGLQKVEREIVSPKAHELGWDLTATDDEEEQQLKALLFQVAASSGDERAKKAAADMFQRFRDGDRKAIHPDMKAGVFASALQYATGNDEFDAILEEFKIAKTGDERSVAIHALGNTRQPEQIQKLLGMLLTDEVKKQELGAPLHSLNTHKLGLQASWEWMKANPDQIREKVDEGIAAIFGEVVVACCANFSSEAAAKEVESFWGARDSRSFDQSVAQAVDDILVKATWLKNGREDVRQWLDKRS